MSETIEAFVNRLQAEGVDAGRKEAARIQEEAEKKARGVISAAESRAKQIVEQAEAEARTTVERAKDELKLAVRDTLMRLRRTLAVALRAVLEGAVTKDLSDADFVRGVIHDVILQYARSDSAGGATITVNVTDEMRGRLADWAMHGLRESLDGSGATVDLLGTLRGAGFEYRVSEGTVEVTVDSVVDALSGLVQPQLGDLLERSLNGAPPAGQATT